MSLLSSHALAAGFAAAVVALAAWAPAHAVPTVLYQQNFENPVNFVNDGGDVNIFRTINQLYSNQPPGFVFTQANTVETLLVGGSQAWNTGFQDPQARAGRYVAGMLSDTQNDLLGLSFNVSGNRYLNVQLDISSIDLDRWGGPFVPAGGLAPIFRLSLFDNPSGASGLGGGAALSFIDVTGNVAPGKNTFNWTNHVAALDAAGNSNGNVILRIDLLRGGYAAIDNLSIVADVDPNTTAPTPTPEPASVALVGVALALLAAGKRRRQR